jgi:hypothetical protein
MEKLMDVERLIKGYVLLRDKKAAMEAKHREELAPIREMMTKVENTMLQHMEETGTTSLSSKGVGTAYQTTRASATISDREAFKQYCEENDAWELADIRAGKTAIREMLESSGELPPGVNWSTVVAVNFKR